MNAATRLPVSESIDYVTTARIATPATQPPSSHPPTSQPRATRKQAWLALHLLDWPLQAALHVAAAQSLHLIDRPLAVVDDDRQRRVLSCNAAALAQGVRAGHTMNASLALCSELKLLPRDVATETSLLLELANWAQRYTPWVSVVEPNELLLEVRGSLRLFGGVQALLQHIRQALQTRQLPTCLTMSATPRASLWLARGLALNVGQAAVVPPKQLKQVLSTLPLHCLHWPVEVQLRLARFGVKRLGELWRLPRADLARRIGIQYLKELDAAVRRQSELHRPFKSMPTYSQQVMLDFEIESISLLEPLLLSCLQHLQTYLREHDLAIDRLYIELLHREHPSTRLRIGLATPSSEMQRTAGLLQEQLLRVILPAPVLAIKIRVKRLLAVQGISQDLLAGSQQSLSQQEKLARLLEKLQARLGQTAIKYLQWQADHRPECAQGYSRVELHKHDTAMRITSLPTRPLWLLPTPLNLSMSAKPPAGLCVMRGPERIEAGWWNNAPLKRDYYVARDAHKAWCWVYKDLLQPAWYLHGWFG